MSFCGWRCLPLLLHPVAHHIWQNLITLLPIRCWQTWPRNAMQQQS